MSERGGFWHIPARGALELERRLPLLELCHLRHVAPEGPERLGRLAREKAPAPALGRELSLLHDDFTAREHRDRPALEPSALIRGVARAVACVKSRSEEHTSELQSRLHLVCRL